MIRFQENAQTDVRKKRKERQTLLYKNFPTTAGGPKRIK